MRWATSGATSAATVTPKLEVSCAFDLGLVGVDLEDVLEIECVERVGDQPGHRAIMSPRARRYAAASRVRRARGAIAVRVQYLAPGRGLI